MALTREVVGALSHAELVDLVVRQSVLIDALQAVIAQQQALIAPLEARVRDLEQQRAQRDKDDPTRRMPGLKPAATSRRRKTGPRKKRMHGFSRPLSPQPTEIVPHAAAQVQGVSTRARHFPAPHADTRERAQRRCEQELLAVCAPYLDADKTVVPQAVLCRRIQKYVKELVTFVAEPAVDSTNNQAERDIRPLVVQRKISGGTRSSDGTATFTALHTLFGTWRAQNREPLVACRHLLLSHAAASL